MKKICNKIGCNKLTKLKEKYCDEHKVVEFESVRRWRRDYDDKRRDDKHRKFYKSQQWKIVRDYILRRDNYLCQNCLKEDRVTTATTVHHIVEIKRDYTKALDENNLITLCHDCHNKTHNRF